MKPRCLVFSPEGFAGVSEELAQQTLSMSERIPRKVGSRRKPLSQQVIRHQLGKVASISINKRSASL
jgi:hypothetical protein